MIGLSSIIIIKIYPNHESNHGHCVRNTEYFSTSTLEVPTAKVCSLHPFKHTVALKAQSHLTSLLDLPEQVMVMLDKLQTVYVNLFFSCNFIPHN